jgi:ribosome assembly protein 1
MKNLDAPQEIFKKLLELSASIDKNGNAIIQSEALNSGLCVKGVVCRPKEPKEVFVVPKAGELTQTEAGESKEEKAGESGAPVKTNIAKEDYEDMIKRISDGHDPDVELSLKDSKTFNIWKNEFRGSLIGGFQSGCASGPLCEEPVRGVLIVLEGVEIAMYERRKKTGTEDDYNIANPITGGMVVAALRTGIRTALLTRPARLMEGHLKLTLHSSLSGLGPLYEVLSKRRGKVLSDTMVEGTDLISIEATLPQFESFGLTSELMKRSSGEVTAPELIFSHWEMLDEDPFWIPTSREDREEYGEIVNNGDISTGLANNALKFIRLVRNRKGLIVDSHKIVVNGEKQRTLARKK